MPAVVGRYPGAFKEAPIDESSELMASVAEPVELVEEEDDEEDEEAAVDDAPEGTMATTGTRDVVADDLEDERAALEEAVEETEAAEALADEGLLEGDKTVDDGLEDERAALEEAVEQTEAAEALADEGLLEGDKTTYDGLEDERAALEEAVVETEAAEALADEGLLEGDIDELAAEEEEEEMEGNVAAMAAVAAGTGATAAALAAVDDDSPEEVEDLAADPYSTDPHASGTATREYVPDTQYMETYEEAAVATKDTKPLTENTEGYLVDAEGNEYTMEETEEIGEEEQEYYEEGEDEKDYTEEAVAAAAVAGTAGAATYAAGTKPFVVGDSIVEEVSETVDELETEEVGDNHLVVTHSFEEEATISTDEDMEPDVILEKTESLGYEEQEEDVIETREESFTELIGTETLRSDGSKVFVVEENEYEDREEGTDLPTMDEPLTNNAFGSVKDRFESGRIFADSAAAVEAEYRSTTDIAGPMQAQTSQFQGAGFRRITSRFESGTEEMTTAAQEVENEDLSR